MTTSTSQNTSSIDGPVSEAAIVNIAAYRFVTLDDLERRRSELRELCERESLKGTILLTPEGINLFIAGRRTGVDRLLDFLKSQPEFADLEVKESLSADQPFERMLVKIKEEIIAFGVDGIDPRKRTSAKLPPKQLKEWLDVGKEVLLLDTRNDYEVRVGTFEKAVPIGVNHFRDFPTAVENLPEETRDKPIVMFCTGGIRCEKAGPFMEQAGFREIYQLEGGILKYFEDCGGDHYQGECFVFDKRVALDPNLQETSTTQCYACLAPLTPEDQQSPHYDPPHTCPHCYEDPEVIAQRQREERVRRLKEVVSPLPGSLPYDNFRPMNVPQQFDGLTLLEFLTGQHPHYGEEAWIETCNAGRIRYRGRPMAADTIVRGGYQLAHFQPAMTEPDVNAEIEILHEDDDIVVVHKPAPLPIHPCGRFHRNTLEWILNEAFQPLKLRPAHRLDANTTGVVVFGKTRAVSRELQPQFEQGTVKKTYLARVHRPKENWQQLTCDARISRETTECGGREIDDENGLQAITHLTRLADFEDGTTLLEVVPETGRTNQIRVHLWHLGCPILGDPLYLPQQELGSTQTIPVGKQMCLHASELSITHPTSKEVVSFVAPRPVWVEATFSA
ncbi:Ribosomal large subunit pseudouridine synthase A [Thalassoglobus neptunius]|uniref:tRNA uridine(34) hydroxylase n=1 Tax=Thalassoglobus neptunius TaxID=1938619 RepID=A0A5C5VIA8_9PLAN|nr:sulfurtransferase [Thalassoglobus neptunius]TWT38298.1 Ribosomal large subunit pseudouridine synthase A [Thalassoglobus neptunius]